MNKLNAVLYNIKGIPTVIYSGVEGNEDGPGYQVIETADKNNVQTFVSGVPYENLLKFVKELDINAYELKPITIRFSSLKTIYRNRLGENVKVQYTTLNGTTSVLNSNIYQKAILTKEDISDAEFRYLLERYIKLEKSLDSVYGLVRNDEHVLIERIL